MNEQVINRGSCPAPGPYETERDADSAERSGWSDWAHASERARAELAQEQAPGPYETEGAAAHAARTAGGPLRDGFSILSAGQNRQLLTQACDSAGVTLGLYDERILEWLSGFEDSTCGVVAGLIARAHAAGRAAR